MKKRSLLILISAVILLGVVGTGLPRKVFRGKENQPPAVAMDETIIPLVLGGLQLVKTVTGDEGLAQVSRLHGKDVGMEQGYIAHYGGNPNKATLWVGWAENDATAQALTDLMTSKIGPDHPIFRDFQAFTFGGRRVYAVTGQGQQHYYFRSGRAVVWVAVDSTAVQEVLHDTLKLFP